MIERLNGPLHERALQFFMLIVLGHWAEHLLQAFQIYVLGAAPDQQQILPQQPPPPPPPPPPEVPNSSALMEWIPSVPAQYMKTCPLKVSRTGFPTNCSPVAVELTSVKETPMIM